MFLIVEIKFCSFYYVLGYYLVSIAVADTHTSGEFSMKNERFYNKEIFKTNSTRNNHTVKFKYISPRTYGEHSYADISTNCVCFKILDIPVSFMFELSIKNL